MVILKLRKVNNMAELQLISTIKAQQSEYLIALTGEIAGFRTFLEKLWNKLDLP